MVPMGGWFSFNPFLTPERMFDNHPAARFKCRNTNTQLKYSRELCVCVCVWCVYMCEPQAIQYGLRCACVCMCAGIPRLLRIGFVRYRDYAHTEAHHTQHKVDGRLVAAILIESASTNISNARNLCVASRHAPQTQWGAVLYSIIA